jgi:hypothetical protein
MILGDESLILEVVLSQWRRLNHSWCVWKVLESAKDMFLEVDPQDNMCHHVSDMERLAY